MTVLAQTLSDDTRVISGLRNNPLFSDAQIVDLLNDALGEARDKFVVALEHWFRASVQFTLAGNTLGSNSFDLTTVPDFQMDQGVNWLQSPSAPPIPIPRLGSFAERGTISGGVGWLTGQQREYFTNGDLLFIDPFTNSAGTYQLIYTPQGVPLAIPAPPPELVSGTPATINAIGTGGVFSFNGSDFTAANVGDALVVAGATNAANNGSFPIASVVDSDDLIVTATTVAESPTGATAVVQPKGSRPDLPAVLTPLALYLKVHAAIAIMTSRKQPTNDLQTKLGAESVRLLALAKKRTEGPKQAPITRRRRRWGVSYLG